MLDRIRNRLRPTPAPAARSRGAAARPRRVSRREREARQRRILYIATAIAGAVVVVALVAGASYQYVIYPRHALASVDGDKIRRRDYWKVREVQLRQNLARLSQQLQSATPDQTDSLNQQVQSIQDELGNLHDAPISSETLSDMIDDRVVMNSLDDMGISISNDEVDAFIDDQFAPVPLIDPTATPTWEPTAAAWATGTTAAQLATATANTIASATAAAATSTVVSQTATAAATLTPQPTTSTTVTASPATTGTAVPLGTPQATPSAETPTASGTQSATTTGSPSATTSGSPTAATTGTPSETGTPSGTESPSATGTATPDKNQSLATSETIFQTYQKNFLNPSDMSYSDYRRLIAAPSLARIKIQEQLLAQIPDRADQVHAAHILVATEDAAKQVEERVKTEDFAAVAREVSTDTTSAPNGGDLGWFSKGVMVAPFEDVAFSLAPGQISEPVQTEFGWHVIKVIEKEANRPVTISALQQERNNSFSKWLDKARAAAKIKADIAIASLTPATTAQQTPTFAPPPDIPPTPFPSPTTIPTALPTESGSPVATTTP